MDKALYAAAQNALKNAYVVYSNFPVSAAMRLKNGDIITGVNVENVSFGLSNCAERTALFTAYAQGFRKEDITEIVVTTDKDYAVSPCGACRQVMSELLLPDVPVHIADAKGNVTTLKNKELLPHAFTEDDLNR